MNFDFLKRFGTLYDLLIDLLNEKMSIKRAKQQQQMISQIVELWIFIYTFGRKNHKKAKNKMQGKKIFKP